MEKTGFTVDLKDFEKKFNDIVKNTIPELARMGLFQAGAQLLRDAIIEEPRAPHKTGALWRSQKIEVSHDKIEVKAGFNIEYAAAVHERPKKGEWTLPGSGPKFLESKLVKNKLKYMRITAEVIKNKGKK